MSNRDDDIERIAELLREPPRRTGRTIISILIVVGVSVAAVVFVFRHQSSGARIEKTEPKSKVITIDKAKWSAAHWDNHEPGVDVVDGNTVQVWMRDVGSITYNAAVGATLLTNDTVEVTAKLSSELPNVNSYDIAFSSDVTLIINGVEQYAVNVIPDNSLGEDCTWKISKNAFKPNQINEITFAVKSDAFYKHGICFYSPIQLKFLEAQ